MTITAVLTVYRRPETLQHQIMALANQTAPPNEIWVWRNRGGPALCDVPESPPVMFSGRDNFGFYSRFAFALLAQTDHVAIIDDDMRPGPSWFANCLETEAKHPGIMCAAGKRFTGLDYAGPWVGWNTGGSPDARQVDMAGHSWFMRRDILSLMFREMPAAWPIGEDIHLAWMAQKHGGIDCWVPPCPDDDMSLWGTDPHFGNEWGEDENASGKMFNGWDQRRNELTATYIASGWKTMAMKGGPS